MDGLLSQLAASDRRVLERLSEHGKAWIVGGWVRDSLQGLNPEEMDIATNLHPDVVMQLFDKTIPVGAAFGTILVLDEDSEKSWEVTTLRSEGTYGDGRRPDKVEFGDDIIEDLARRDFTINAMALDPITGEIIDEFGGIDDLNAGIIRAVGNAHERISEDGLRIMRAFRFLDSGELELRNIEKDMRDLIDHASDRFDGKRTAIESDANRRAEVIDTKLKELEDRLRTMLQRALDNPLAGQ